MVACLMGFKPCLRGRVVLLPSFFLRCRSTQTDSGISLSDFDNPSGGILGLVTTAQTIGSAGALPIGPYITDRFGRRPPIAIGSLLVIPAAGLQGGAQNLGMFIGSRVVIGIGSSFVATAAAPLVAELAYPSHRGIITAIYNTSWVLTPVAGH
jgi:MFS family permease